MPRLTLKLGRVVIRAALAPGGLFMEDGIPEYWGSRGQAEAEGAHLT